jgi:hypothetical protein
MTKHEGYRQLVDPTGEPFTSYRAFCEARLPWGLGYPPEVIDAIIRERITAQARADQAEGNPLPDHGEVGNGRSRGSVTTSTGKRDIEYLARRIARDRPDIIQDMKAGKYKSVRAAAIEAGIVKVPTVLEQIQKLWHKASEDERQSFLAPPRDARRESASRSESMKQANRYPGRVMVFRPAKSRYQTSTGHEREGMMQGNGIPLIHSLGQSTRARARRNISTVVEIGTSAVHAREGMILAPVSHVTSSPLGRDRRLSMVCDSAPRRSPRSVSRSLLRFAASVPHHHRRER